LKKNGIIIPHEHGGWAMVSIPFMIGMLAGQPQWMHGLLFLAWFGLYLASYPLLQAVKKTSNRGRLIRWGIGYSIFAALFLIPSLMYYPKLVFFGPIFLVLLGVNIWHSRRKSERAILNDLCAILLFSMGGAAAYLFAGGSWNGTMAAVVMFSFLHFMGSAFFVKTVFRERGNRYWSASSRIYHVLLLVLPWVAGYPWMIAAYGFSALKAWIYTGKALRPWKVGVMEIVGSILFLVASIMIL
jgi:hypothetical protein